MHEDSKLPEQGAILFVDKAEGWTSHDIVAKTRRALGTRKVGHAGTLDPMATGLLVLGIGPATRLLTYLVGLGKTYETTIRLGISTVSDDREGNILDIAPPAVVEELAAHPERIRASVAGLTGDIEQAPSAVSAIKVDGKRAYDRVRDGEQVELKKRPVTVDSFEIEEPRLAAAVGISGGEMPVDVIDIDAVVECSSGTYIRALARDLGNELDVGGHLVALRRTRVGPFGLSGATQTADLAEGRVGRLVPPAEIARLLFPELPLSEEQAVDLGNGKRLEVAAHPDAPIVVATAPDGRLVGLVEIHKGHTRVVMNFPVTGSATASKADQ